MKDILILGIVMATLLFASCGSKEATNATIAPLSGSFAVNFMGSVDVSQVQPTLVFNNDEKTVSGYAGCNRFSASYTLTETEISFSKVVTTKMACPKGMEEERMFVEALESANRYTAQKDRVILFKDDTVLVKAQNPNM